MLAKFFKKYSLAEWAYILIVIPGTMAFFQSDTTLNPRLDVSIFIRVALTYLVTFYLVAYMFRRTVTTHQLQLMGVIFIWWFICSFHRAPGASVPINFLMLILLLVYSYFRKWERIRIYELYRLYIVVMSAGGVLAYLFYITGLPMPCSIVPYYLGDFINGRRHAWGEYYNYYIGVLNVVGPMTRLCGWFNEPGYFGTIASLVLIIDNVNLRRRGNIVILVATIFSFSMAAFVILFGYLLTMAIRKAKSAIMLIIFAVVLGTAVPFLFKGDSTYQFFIERFEVNDGKIKADNRTNSDIFTRLQDQQFESVEETLFGNGSGALNKFGSLYIAGIKVQLYLYGIVGILLTYGLLFLVAWRLTKGSYQAKAFVIWFFLSTYQRPYIFSIDYMLILFGGIAYIQYKYGNSQRIPKAIEQHNSNRIGGV